MDFYGPFFELSKMTEKNNLKIKQIPQMVGIWIYFFYQIARWKKNEQKM
ncbi:MAG: hypothetical protein CM1200mP16_11070 [Nitrospina sp.]|nr:MAG: hypothetical protein CM1200mP16_11070 [Nitrospina sp.]